MILDPDSEPRLGALKVGFRDRSIIDPKNAFDDWRQIGRYRQRVAAAAICSAVVLVLLDRRAECFGEIGGGTGEKNAAPCRRSFDDDEIIGLRKCLDFLQIRRVGAVIGRIMLPGQIFAFPGSLVGMKTVCRECSKRGLAADADGDLKSLVGRHRANHMRAVKR